MTRATAQATQHQVLLLGPPAFVAPGGQCPLPSVRGQALLWYLAAQPGRVFSRPELSHLLWPEEEHGGKLRTTLWRLRSALPVWPLLSQGDSLGWDDQSGVAVDTARFEQLAAGDAVGAWVTAVGLWRGAFLQGFDLPENDNYEQWLSEQRHYWSRRLLDSLARITDTYVAAVAWEQVKTYAGQALDIDPLNERFCGYLMLAHYHRGERTEALARYNGLRQRLQAELGVEPDAATAALRNMIAAGELARPPQGVAAAQGLASAATPVPDTLPLAGRREELAACLSALSRARGGGGRVVLLNGEAGIGKSRLTAEVLTQLQAGDAYTTVLVGNCYETEMASPLAPFLAALHDRLPSVELAGQGRRLVADMARLLAELPGPVLIILEDIHWADWESLQLVAYLARQPVARAITLLVSCRAEEAPDQTKRLLLQLQREQRLTWLEIGPLTEAAIADLVASGMGQSNAGLSQWLFSQSGGNSLFAVELLRASREGGLLVGGSPAALASLPVPPGVRLVILGKLLRLDQPERQLLRTASLFPAGVAFDTLCRVAGLEPAAALAALETLLQARLLAEGREGRLAFAHDLVRRLVYEDVSQATRQALHRHAAGCLEAAAAEAGWAADSAPPLAALRPFWSLSEQILYHAMAGGLWEQGLTWSLKAAAGARARSFHATAVRFLEQALACLQQLTSSPQRQELRFAISLDLANSSVYVQPDQMPAFQAAAATAAAATSDVVQLALVKVSESIHLFVSGRHREGQALLEPLLPLARAAGNDKLLGSCLQMLGTHLAARGRFKLAKAYLAEAAPLEDSAGDHVEAAMSRSTAALIRAFEGDFAGADAAFQPLLAAVRAAQDAVAEVYVLAFIAQAESVRGNWQAVAAAAQGAAALNRETGHLWQEYLARLFAGPAMAQLGDVAGGLRAQEEVLALAGQLPTTALLGQAYAWLGQLQLAVGDVRSAEAAARKGLEIASRQDCPYDLALCKRVLGQVVAARGRQQPAVVLLKDALQRFTALGARPELARCHAVLARVGSSSERAVHRSSAAHLFLSLGMKWDLARLRQEQDL